MLKLIKKLAFFFVKYECVACGVNINSRKAICFDCSKNIGAIDQSSICHKCGRYCLTETCIFCITSPPLFKKGKAFCVYDATSSQIIKQFKYHGNPLCERLMVKKMTKIFTEQLGDARIDIITCVPMSFLKEYWKGRNHAGILASKVAKSVEIDYNATLLKRKFTFKRQALLNQKERISNVKNVFRVQQKSLVFGKNILIIDDTITTGSTLNECTKALLDAGAKSVFVLTFAKSITDEKILNPSVANH